MYTVLDSKLALMSWRKDSELLQREFWKWHLKELPKPSISSLSIAAQGFLFTSVYSE